MSIEPLSVSKDTVTGRSQSRNQENQGSPEYDFSPEARYTWYLFLKPFLDFVLALLLLLPLLPPMLIAAFVVKLTSRGPAFFKQTRIGKEGRLYQLYKIRTMVHKAEKFTGPVWSNGNDPRITAVGRVLRTTHIDEFPQLFNVLLGQMSLIGPRPERPEFVSSLEWSIPNYRDRLKVRPGITGMAQLNLPPDTDLESVKKKLTHDIYYIHLMNPWLDLRILIYTFWLFFKEMCSFLWALVSLPNPECVSSRLENLSQAQAHNYHSHAEQ